ncbi:MAG: DMT family transporter [Pseudomonadota bacterium]|nr:DMT family transporter [Pseudomonadota bacterium]
MNQTMPLQQKRLQGAAFMVISGITFAVINAVTFVITAQLGLKPQSDTFWQYAIALVISVPFLLSQSKQGLKTKHPIAHLARVAVSALGLLAFTTAIAKGVPVWQVVALTMTAPFFVLIGAAVYLRETVPLSRWIAALVGFSGALIVTNPWSEQFTWAWLLPVVAAILWGAASLFTKYLTRDESAESLTVWLLLLLTPINALLSLGAGFELPTAHVFLWLLAGGALVCLAQYFSSRSYAAADANFVQPFDDLKLISNVLIYGILFGYWPSGFIWLGLAMIMVASAYIMWRGRTEHSLTSQAA